MTSGDGRLLTKRKVQELVAEIDGNERLEGDVEDVSFPKPNKEHAILTLLPYSSCSRLLMSSSTR